MDQLDMSSKAKVMVIVTDHQTDVDCGLEVQRISSPTTPLVDREAIVQHNSININSRWSIGIHSTYHRRI